MASARLPLQYCHPAEFQMHPFDLLGYQQSPRERTPFAEVLVWIPLDHFHPLSFVYAIKRTRASRILVEYVIDVLKHLFKHVSLVPVRWLCIPRLFSKDPSQSDLRPICEGIIPLTSS